MEAFWFLASTTLLNCQIAKWWKHTVSWKSWYAWGTSYPGGQFHHLSQLKLNDFAKLHNTLCKLYCTSSNGKSFCRLILSFYRISWSFRKNKYYTTLVAILHEFRENAGGKCTNRFTIRVLELNCINGNLFKCSA